MAAPNPKLRQQLSAPGLYQMVRQSLGKALPQVKGSTISSEDIAMSALAMFSMKYSSLLSFDRDTHATDPTVAHNLGTLFGVKQIPCDTQLRQRLDNVKPDMIRQAYRQIWQVLQRQKVLQPYKALDGHLLISVDGTGHFSSSSIRCPQCCVKHTKKGEQYYHQLLGAVCVRPGIREVLPLDAEPITKGDGNTKNDCERHASKRLLERIRQDHPQMKICILEDSLASNAPHIRLLHQLKMDFILGVKFTDHVHLAQCMDERFGAGKYQESASDLCTQDKDQRRYGWRIYQDLPLNASAKDIRVNVVEYWEQKSAKDPERFTNFSWVTNLEVNSENVMEYVQAGRARWKVENETFNTLKNHGYHLEHNYGHGKKNLASNLGLLTILAFLIDQVQEHCCRVFQQARDAHYSRKAFWDRLRRLFLEFAIRTWERLYAVLRDQLKGFAALYADTG